MNQVTLKLKHLKLRRHVDQRLRMAQQEIATRQDALGQGLRDPPASPVVKIDQHVAAKYEDLQGFNHFLHSTVLPSFQGIESK